MTPEIVKRLTDACNGHPDAKIPWPHRLLHDAIDEIERLTSICFKLGAMDHAPCFVCGYGGEGYYQPGKHRCAERHHMECET